ncbi:MAG: alpha-amylase family glycosyl hydrolase [Cyclobacteriaceae bacterium]|nr:alpha-amylase family glycosyl hydrolase [Cyclobacteriaceae bacterium]
MKYIYYLFCIGFFFSCKPEGDKKHQLISTWPNGITYEIFVQSFCDSNGDGIGDIPGMTQKLDYLQSLGIEAIWLMPINPSPSYHKYDVTDYYDIHPDYGTLDDFKSFVTAAHQRGIKVIMDLVINHSSDKHPWFVEAASDISSPYRDYYVWADKDSIARQIAKKETSFDSDNITQWHAANGDTLGNHYYGFFTGMMPDFNFDNPQVRQEFYKIGRFWMEEIGVDGFRLDAAKHIYPDDRAGDNHAFWEEFRREMQTIKSDAYTVGEVWANATSTAEYTGGFSALFNFDLAFSILESVKKEEIVSASISGHGWKVAEKSFIIQLAENKKLFSARNPDFTDAVFLSNHDQNRYMSVLGNSPEKARLATAILFTLPGQPYLYYGEEIGMLGQKPDPNIREPFLWDTPEKDTTRTKWMEPVFTTDQTITPLSAQQKDPHSLFNHYKNLIHLRRTNKALAFGDITPIETGNKALVAFERSTQDTAILVIHNLLGVSQNFERTGLSPDIKLVYGQAEVKGQSLQIPAYGSVVVGLTEH